MEIRNNRPIRITGPLWLWFVTESSLCKMENKSFKSGVPQLRQSYPVLSIHRIQHSKCFLFADDTKLLKSFRDEILMQDDLNALSLWCEKWNIGLNVAKCKTIRLSLKQTEETSHYSVQDNTIEQVNSYRDLGIIVI